VPYDLKVIRPAAGRSNMLVRFSLGFEAVDDLIADCEQALRASGLA
jgi:cystathionine beta-lyase